MTVKASDSSQELLSRMARLESDIERTKEFLLELSEQLDAVTNAAAADSKKIKIALIMASCAFFLAIVLTVLTLVR